MEVVGVILAGGTGSRLLPLTKVTNKHLLPVGREPMIHYPVKRLVRAGIKKICVVTGTEHMGDVVSLLGSGRELGCEFTYRVQDQAGGIAQALALAEHFVGKNRVVVILGDNIIENEITDYVASYMAQPTGAKVLLKQVEDPKRFGVATVKDGLVTKIVEKPSEPESDMAVTGFYMYDHRVFGFIKTLKPSARGELEITDVNNAYLAEGTLTSDVLTGWWTDAGTFSSLHKAQALALALEDQS
jgi:glucose-1-phosphate thymidylyltransferase